MDIKIRVDDEGVIHIHAPGCVLHAEGLRYKVLGHRLTEQVVVQDVGEVAIISDDYADTAVDVYLVDHVAVAKQFDTVGEWQKFDQSHR